jgi:hypothetical protein
MASPQTVALLEGVCGGLAILMMIIILILTNTDDEQLDALSSYFERCVCRKNAVMPQDDEGVDGDECTTPRSLDSVTMEV